MVMNNSDDTFIREVNEELRSEQLQTAWKRFRPFIIGLAVLIVVGVAGSALFEWWQARESSASGDRFLTAIKAANDKQAEEATKQLEQLTKDGFGSYPVLARMRLATLKAEKGDAKGAIADFLAIGQDAGVPKAMRNVAKLRAAWLMVGLSAYRADNYAKARDWLQMIVDDNDAPAGARTRARMVLALIKSSGKLT
jgi:hypothetical protein